jgi:hypothetical protein
MTRRTYGLRASCKNAAAAILEQGMAAPKSGRFSPIARRNMSVLLQRKSCRPHRRGAPLAGRPRAVFALSVECESQECVLEIVKSMGDATRIYSLP